jgi:hypothetical protein
MLTIGLATRTCSRCGAALTTLRCEACAWDCIECGGEGEFWQHDKSCKGRGRCIEDACGPVACGCQEGQ